jgi:hypothetical protein
MMESFNPIDATLGKKSQGQHIDYTAKLHQKEEEQ